MMDKRDTCRKQLEASAKTKQKTYLQHIQERDYGWNMELLKLWSSSGVVEYKIEVLRSIRAPGLPENPQVLLSCTTSSAPGKIIRQFWRKTQVGADRLWVSSVWAFKVGCPMML
jgi:hypothetical protein